MRLSKSLKQLITNTARDAYAKGVADGERKILTGLKAVAQLNGSFGAVAPLAGFARKAEADDTHALLVSAMLQVAEDAADTGDDPADALKALAGLSQDPDRLRDVLAGGTLQKAWDESLHPRDHGKFSSKPGAAGRSDGSGLDDSGNDLTDRPRSRSQAEAAAGVIRDILMGECGGDTKDWCVTTAEAVRAAFPDAEVWDGNYDGDGDQAHTIFKLGDWFVDVTADQFGGPDVFVARELPEDTYPDFAPTEAGRPAEVGRRMAAAMRAKFARRLEKAWDESLHPRDDSGRFIGKDKLQAAKSDPHLAQQLRAKTTDPGERAKLDKVLSGEADPGRTRRGEQRHQSQQKRAATEADRRRAHRLAMRAFEPGGLGYDDYEELAGLLPSLTVEQLRSVRAAVGASWGGQRLKRQGMVDTLVAFARQQAAPAEQDAPGSPGWQARMMNREPQPKPGVDAWESAKVDDAADRAGRMGAWESDRPDSEAAGAVAGAARADLAGARGWAADVATATPGLSSPPPADNRLDDKLDNPEPEPAAKLASRLDELEADASRRLAEAERPLTGNRYADVSDADLGAVRHRLAAKVAGLKQSATATGDEAGVVVAGLGHDKHGYPLADLSVQGSPALWGSVARIGAVLFGADKIVAEANNGGQMVEMVIRTIGALTDDIRQALYRIFAPWFSRAEVDAAIKKAFTIPVRLVHASRGKLTRAEPVQALANALLLAARQLAGKFIFLSTQANTL